MPIIAYGFIGVDVVSVTAFEARDLRSLRIPSRIIAYFVVVLYFMCAVGEFLNVGWTCGSLPTVLGANGTLVVTTDKPPCDGAPQRTTAIIVIAARGYRHAPGLFNAFGIYSCLSAANSSLYIASRILYGMTRTISPWRRLSVLKALGTVWHKTGVPMWALLISFIAFIWLPFLQLKKGNAIDSVSLSLLIYWSSVYKTAAP